MTAPLTVYHVEHKQQSEQAQDKMLRTVHPRVDILPTISELEPYGK